MFLYALAFASTYCSYVPFSDDWIIVTALTGEQPVTAAWLWQGEGDQRVPLAKVLLLGLYKSSGGDFRVGMFANALCLGLLAFAMIRAAKNLRGRTAYVDALFPLALLNLDREKVFIGLGVNSVPGTVLAGIVLLIIVRRGTRLRPGAAVLTGVCVVSLALIGPNGLAMVPALALWLAYVGVLYWRSPESHGRRNALLVWGLAAAALILVPLYFVDLPKPEESPPSPSLWATLTASLEFLSMSFGQASSHFMTDHLTQPFFGLGVVILGLISALLLAGVWFRRPQERPRALGLFLFLVAMAMLALGTGWARAGRGPGAGYAPRYVVLAVPVLCCLFFVWEVYGPPAVRRLPQMCLFTLLCFLFPQNMRETFECGKEHGEKMEAVERDVREGTPPGILSERYVSFLVDPLAGEAEKPVLADFLRMMRRAGIGPFRSLKEDSAIRREVQFPVVPIATNQMTWKDGVGEGQGEDPYLVFALKEPQFVQAIRIKYAYEKTAPPVTFQMFWRRSDRNDFAEEERNSTLDLKPMAEEATLTIQVADVIDQFRIDPDTKPCVFKLTEIVILVPEADYPRVRDLYKDSAYQRSIQQIGEVVRAKLPADATVLVVTKGDDDLLKFEGRRGWHFPQTADGEYAGNPADSAEAIAQLEKLRAKGGQFLLFPEPYFWWLEEYKEFKRHLDDRYARVHADKYCIIYQLGEPKAR
jgi:hypothetical protein